MTPAPPGANIRAMTTPSLTTTQQATASALVTIGHRILEWVPEAFVEADRLYVKIMFTDVDSDIMKKGPSLPFAYNKTDAPLTTEVAGTVEGVDWAFGKFTPKQVWDERHIWEAQIEQSISRWETYTEQQRAAIIAQVVESINNLVDNAELLPNVELASGNFIDFFFTV